MLLLRNVLVEESAVEESVVDEVLEVELLLAEEDDVVSEEPEVEDEPEMDVTDNFLFLCCELEGSCRSALRFDGIGVMRRLITRTSPSCSRLVGLASRSS